MIMIMITPPISPKGDYSPPLSLFSFKIVSTGIDSSFTLILLTLSIFLAINNFSLNIGWPFFASQGTSAAKTRQSEIECLNVFFNHSSELD